MDLSAMKDLYIGSTPVQSAWLGGTKVWERTPTVDIQAIKDAMLLWYDLKRQGATNESMAATPELVNLAYDPDKAHVIDWTQFSTRGDGVQQFSIEITSTTNYWVINQGAYHRTNSIPSFYVEVANLPQGKVINYFYGNGSDERQTYAITYNGLHKLPACKISPNVTTASGFFISNENGQTVADVVGTTITQVNPSLNATCYNFAWIGMSSVGGYYFDSLHDDAKTSGEYTYNVSEDFTKFTFLTSESATRENFFACVRKIEGTENVHFSFRITGLSEFRKGYPNAKVTTGSNEHSWYEDGEYEHNETLTDTYISVYLNCEGGIPVGEQINITIEQIPEYPNALVLDGVDDYTLTENLPLLNDFTVIGKRTFVNPDEMGTFASKSTLVYPEILRSDGAFIMDCNSGDGFLVAVYGLSSQNIIYKDGISYMTPYYYNGTTELIKGTCNDTSELRLGAIRSLEVDTTRLMRGAIYSFILFDRTLTNDEIDWVKTNLIEGDTEL